MWWFEMILPPRNVMQEDLESRGIDFAKWSELARKDQKLPQKLSECYARHNHGRRFDEQLHQCGVKLRLDRYRQWLLQKYPELRADKNT